jgi:integrase
MKRRSIITVGTGDAEIKIYTLHRGNGYTCYNCAWYELGRRQTKMFGKMESAKFFAQQRSALLRNKAVGLPEVNAREIELYRACEGRVSRFGLTVPVAIEEWSAAKAGMNGGLLLDAVRFYNAHHSGLPNKTLSEVADGCIRAKESANLSPVYLKGFRHYLRRLADALGAIPIADVTTGQIDAWLAASSGNTTTKNNLRRNTVTLFSWAREQGYLLQERKTVAERAMTFAAPDAAPEIFTSDELRKILAVCTPAMLPLIVIGAFAGIRSAEIDRLEWSEILWEQGYIEIKAKKAKTKSRRLVPLLPNLRAWLEPYRGRSGFICRLTNRSVRLNYLGEKSGIGWRQNALRHSFASYRLAELQDAAKVALEMGNSPEKLFRHYRELVTSAAAKEWFSIMPPQAS